ncbi:hypothetical protein JL722_14482 [Aureococcus anophagefferens]|nr:hypothetical protein JL722_14482 [Aureococcus anophagefferens]
MVENPSLVALNFEKNHLDATAAEALSDRLRRDAQIRYLNLRRNDVSWQGAIRLANALETNLGILHLDLGFNGVGSCGPIAGRALADMICKNAILRHLDLEGNDIGPDAGAAIAAALMRNNTLQFINMINNHLENETGEAFLAPPDARLASRRPAPSTRRNTGQPTCEPMRERPTNMFRSTWTSPETCAERSSIIQRADMDRRMMLHAQRLASMRSTVDTSPPDCLSSGLRRNVKQELLQQERHDEIMRDNRTLIEHLGQIGARENGHRRDASFRYPVSHSAVVRKRAAKRIHAENLASPAGGGSLYAESGGDASARAARPAAASATARPGSRASSPSRAWRRRWAELAEKPILLHRIGLKYEGEYALASVLRAARNAQLLIVTFYFPEKITTYTTALSVDAAAAWLKIDAKVLRATELRLSARVSREQAEDTRRSDASRAAKYWEQLVYCFKLEAKADAAPEDGGAPALDLALCLPPKPLGRRSLSPRPRSDPRSSRARGGEAAQGGRGARRAPPEADAPPAETAPAETQVPPAETAPAETQAPPARRRRRAEAPPARRRRRAEAPPAETAPAATQAPPAETAPAATEAPPADADAGDADLDAAATLQRMRCRQQRRGPGEVQVPMKSKHHTRAKYDDSEEEGIPHSPEPVARTRETLEPAPEPAPPAP